MQGIKIEDEGSMVSWEIEQMYASEQSKEPSSGGVLHLLSDLIGEGSLLLYKRLPDLMLNGRIDHQAEGHDEDEGFDSLGVFDEKIAGHELWILQKPEASFDFGEALVFSKHLIVR